MSILVMGATGLLGNAVFRVLSETNEQIVVGTIRNAEARQFFIPELAKQLHIVDDLTDTSQMIALLDILRPRVIINCTSLSKNTPKDFAKMVSVFSTLPRRLAHLCRLRQVRLIQISTDGVFKGGRGSYTEDDLPDANDPYATAKLLGEVEGPGVITLRTSIIGHEIFSKNSLLEWFLSQNGSCNGYTNAYFSGFPSVVLAQVIRDIILPRPELEGIYHLATSPISKFDLLQLIAQRYGLTIRIIPDDTLKVNLSLSADHFRRATGYAAPEWPQLIDTMYSYKFGLKGN